MKIIACSTNPGKLFERDFKNSIPEDVLIQRMIDPVQSFLTGPNTIFSPRQPYDFFMYSYPILFCLELKSKGIRHITFYREDFVVGKVKEDDFDIKKHQIEGLTKARMHEGIMAGFVINFRIDDHTYYFDIDDFNWLIEDLPKKSINEEDILAAGGILIDQELVRTRYRYDIHKFIEDAKRYMKNENQRKGSKRRRKIAYEKEIESKKRRRVRRTSRS